MAQLDRCPKCGKELHVDARRVHCPSCLLQQGQGDETLSLALGAVAATLDRAGQGSVSENLAAALIPLPRVLLRDIEPVTGPGPVARPSSPEMPDPAGRPARLQLLGEIARGGMGAILKGRDTDIGRDLAVKVLLEAHCDHPDLVRRFVEEAQIAGQLQHPGIVPIYELGAFADRRPYFAMKLVKGQTLAGLLDGRDDPAAGLHRLLGIFEAVCHATAYAHARGVIHRDLKPSNVMVGSFGEVQVMDWGLAKVLHRGGAAEDAAAGRLRANETVISTPRSVSDSDLSVAGSVMGTPAYMAPEQARGEVDHMDERCDVFALGSILCEILTGLPAFTGRTSGEIQRKAARGDLADSRARLDACGAESELIDLAKACLAPEPDDRPRDAQAVTDAMAAHLAGVQERLHAAELAQVEAQVKVAEERRRRLLTVALAASVLGTALMGGGGWAYVARQRAAREAATAVAVNRAMAEATLLRGQARAASAADLTAWSEALAAARRAEELLDQGEGGDTLRGRVVALRSDIAHGLDAARARGRAVEADRRMVQRLLEIRIQLADQVDRARSNADYATAFHDYGIDVNALDPTEAGARIAARPIAVELAEALDHWTFNRRGKQLSDPEGARRLVAVANVADPDPWRVRFREIQVGNDLEALRRLAATADPARLPSQSVLRLAFCLGNLGDRESAVTLLLAAQRHRRDDFWINYDLAFHLLSMKPPRVQEALRYSMALLALRPQSQMAHQKYGDCLRASGDIDGAIAEHREAIRLAPGSPYALTDLANVLRFAGKVDEATAEYREAIRLKPDFAAAHGNLGLALAAKGDLDAAIAACREAIRLEPDNFFLHNSLGWVLKDRKGDHEGAMTEFREAIRLKPDDVWAQKALREAERWIGLEGRLPSVLHGDDRPKDEAERLDFAKLCKLKGMYAASVRFYGEAFAARPELADDLKAWPRYNAACYAALAGSGRAKDNPPPDEAARTRLREQALAWLRDDLAAWARRTKGGTSSTRDEVRKKMRHWQSDPDLASLRDEAEVAKLPEAERAACHDIWARVGLLLLDVDFPADPFAR